MQPITTTPRPPYYAVISTSINIDDDRGYDEHHIRVAKVFRDFGASGAV